MPTIIIQDKQNTQHNSETQKDKDATKH
jgi:hypothetical protein